MDKQARIKQFGEVFTPQWVVDLMCDSLEKEAPGAFAVGTTFLEPTCGEGIFVIEILRRKFANCQKRADYTEALRSVYAMELQADNVQRTIEAVTALCRETFRPTREEEALIRDHIIQADALKVMRMIADLNERDAGDREGRPYERDGKHENL